MSKGMTRKVRLVIFMPISSVSIGYIYIDFNLKNAVLGV